jgi:hypothetical protein
MTAGRPRFSVVSWSTGAPLHLSPREQRATYLEEGLAVHGGVERLGRAGASQWVAGSAQRTGTSSIRRVGKRLVDSLLIDKFELSARHRLRSWHPQVDGAVLVGFPFSPLAPAARRLSERGIPFVVDVGDPWVVTNPEITSRTLAQRRGAAAESYVWQSARGGIVTTLDQGRRLKQRFPHLDVLVRPNGYVPNGGEPSSVQARRKPGDELRLVHYGSLYGERVDLRSFLAALAGSGRWRRIVLTQIGSDWENVLGQVEDLVEVVREEPRPWPEVLRTAAQHAAALVIGWSNPGRMPSKVLQYMTLPIPRVALATPSADDALASYLDGRDAWSVIRDDQIDPGLELAALIDTDWSAAQLRAPEDEAWPAVAAVLGDFVVEATGACTLSDRAAAMTREASSTWRMRL